MNRGGWRLVVTILFLLWIFAVVSAYYAVHKPFGLARVQALGEAAAGLVGAGLVLALGAGTGVLLVRCLDLAPAERLAWATGLGLGVVSLAGLGLGAVGLLRPWLLWGLTAVGLLAVGRPLWQVLQAAWADPVWRPQGRFEKLLAGYCAVMLAVALAWALAPPTAWDALDYHLTGPKLYLASGWVSHPLDLPHLGFPQLVEMLFAWGMGLTGELAAAPIHWFYGVVGVLALVAAGRRRWGGAAGWVAAAVLLSAPTIVLLAGQPYVDVALLVYAVLAFLALMRCCEEGRHTRWWVVLSGLFAGMALSTKYTALAVLPALTLALLVVHVRDPLAAIRRGLVLGGGALAAWCPWLLKNLLLTGNPTYPFFFGGIYWDHWRAAWYDQARTGLLTTKPWGLLTAPWDATVWGVEGGFGYSATIGPLFLALLPSLFLLGRREQPGQRSWLWAALAFCGVLYGFWLWGLARSAHLLQTRLLFPAFGVLALLLGAAVARMGKLPRCPVNLGWLVRGVILIVLLLGLVETGLAWVREGPQWVLLGFESRQAYLDRRLGMYHLAIQTVNALPEDSEVLFLWEERSYHCQVTCHPDSLLDRWAHTTRCHGLDAAAIADAWRAEGVTHVLWYRWGYERIVEAGFDPITEADQEALDRLVQTELVLMEDLGGVYQLYALRQEDDR